jgi:hypothetical protein
MVFKKMKLRRINTSAVHNGKFYDYIHPARFALDAISSDF